jgi:YVTN family beta-propeller protein
MQLRLITLLFAAATATASAQTGDRVYTADQTSNTVSVIDPATDKLLGSIRLGEDVPAALSPVYRGELLAHGLGFSPDHKTLDVISIGSNSVTLIDTETNTVKGKIYLGRSPHEGFFRPDGRELWVAVRGENYVSVIEPPAEERGSPHRDPEWSGPLRFYGFPESHAASFALIAYASAYLKRRYLAAFLCALLNNQPMGFYSPATLLKDAQRHGLKVFHIDAQHSDWKCTLEPLSIEETLKFKDPFAVRVGLSYCRGLRRKAGEAIAYARSIAPFTSVYDLARRVPELRRQELVMLAQIGAFRPLNLGLVG